MPLYAVKIQTAGWQMKNLAKNKLKMKSMLYTSGQQEKRQNYLIYKKRQIQ
jgi:hypothetical protein